MSQIKYSEMLGNFKKVELLKVVNPKETTLDFKINIVRLSNAIKEAVKDCQDEGEIITNETRRLILEYAVKDDDGNVIYDSYYDNNGKLLDKKPRGLLPYENKEFQIKSEEITERRKNLLNKEIDFTFDEAFKRKDISKIMHNDFGALIEVLIPYLED